MTSTSCRWIYYQRERVPWNRPCRFDPKWQSQHVGFGFDAICEPIFLWLSEFHESGYGKIIIVVTILDVKPWNMKYEFFLNFSFFEKTEYYCFISGLLSSVRPSVRPSVSPLLLLMCAVCCVLLSPVYCLLHLRRRELRVEARGLRLPGGEGSEREVKWLTEWMNEWVKMNILS